MKTNRSRVWFIGVVSIYIGVLTHGTAQAQVNSWANPQSGTWNWAVDANWSLGLAPSVSQSAIFITNAASDPFFPPSHFRTVLIGPFEASNPGTMIISNLTVSAPGSGINGNHNALFLTNAGTVTPLHILSSLIISNGGSVLITNSVLLVGDIFDDGFLQLNTGTVSNPDGDILVGSAGHGQMMVLDGTCQGDGLVVGSQSLSQGTLTLAGGTSTFSAVVEIGFDPAAVGIVSVTGGILTTTNTEVHLGVFGSGQMTVSGGTWQAGDVIVGTHWESSGSGQGTLTLAGGASTFFGPFTIGNELDTTGTVWMTGGQLITTNASTVLGSGAITPGPLAGRMIVSNGTWQARDVIVGYGVDTEGTLAFAGGITTVSSNLVLGDCALGAEGTVRVTGGTLYVTNASHTASIDVRNGTFWVAGVGSVVVDVMVMTNPCSQFVREDGFFTWRTAILDPNADADGDGLPNGWELAHGLDPFDPNGDNGTFGDPDGDGYDNYEEYLAGSDPQNPLSTPSHPVAPPFQITSMVRSGNNIILTWNAVGGITNQVQVTSGGTGGSYSTNGFTNLGAQMIIGGSSITTTNFNDLGGATNKPARYYRIGLVP